MLIKLLINGDNGGGLWISIMVFLKIKTDLLEGNPCS